MGNVQRKKKGGGRKKALNKKTTVMVLAIAILPFGLFLFTPSLLRKGYRVMVKWKKRGREK